MDGLSRILCRASIKQRTSWETYSITFVILPCPFRHVFLKRVFLLRRRIYLSSSSISLLSQHYKKSQERMSVVVIAAVGNLRLDIREVEVE